MCGESPLYLPLFRVRSLSSWMTPLAGCARCRYPYERESGYFLLATWAVGYGATSLLGLFLWLVASMILNLDLTQTLLFVLLPLPVFSILFVRHAKALWLAFDHFWDPHVKPRTEGERRKAR
ncbi:MAG: hypothetical protein ACRD16_17300 [Thermoanaerobaculia bacterium]